MARELHDSIAHSLTAIVVQAEAAEDALDRDPEAARPPLHNIGATGREALVEMRHVVGALRGSERESLAGRRGAHGIEELVATARASGISHSCRSRARGKDWRLPSTRLRTGSCRRR